MKRFKLITALLLAVLMTGCNDVPDDVKSRTEQREAARQGTIRDGEVEYLTLAEMQADIGKALSGKYSNFTLRDGMKVDLPEKLMECDFVQASGFIANAEKVRDTFFTKDESKGMELEYSFLPPFDPDDTDGKGSAVCGFRSEEKRLHFGLWDNGFFCAVKPGLFEQMTNGYTVKFYHPERGENLSDTYKIGSENISVREAVDKAQKWIEEKYAPLEPEYTFRIETVEVVLNDSDEYGMKFIAAKYYKGVKLDDLSFKTNTEERVNDPDKPTKIELIKTDLITAFKDSTETEYITNGYGMYNASEGKTLDKAVSLSSALGYIEKTFTDFNEPLDICEINLKYMLHPDYDPKTQRVNDPGVKFEGRLVWEFVINIPESYLRDYAVGLARTVAGDDIDPNKISYQDLRKYICIDVENCELFYEFELNMLTYGG